MTHAVHCWCSDPRAGCPTDMRTRKRTHEHIHNRHHIYLGPRTGRARKISVINARGLWIIAMNSQSFCVDPMGPEYLGLRARARGSGIKIVWKHRILRLPLRRLSYLNNRRLTLVHFLIQVTDQILRISWHLEMHRRTIVFQQSNTHTHTQRHR